MNRQEFAITARLALACIAFASAPAYADMFCGPGKHVGSENGDGAGQSWLCVPDRGTVAPIIRPQANLGARQNLRPSVPAYRPSGGGGGNRAAAGLAGAAGVLGGVANLLDAIDAVQNSGGGGRDPDRDGDLVPGGMAAYQARANDVIGIQYLAMGIALEEQSLVEAAADSYARAERAAAEAGDEELLGMVRERQAALGCRNAMGFIMNTGQNPELRLQQYQRLKSVCQGPLAEALQGLIAMEQERIPGGAPQAKASFGEKFGSVREMLDRALRDRDSGRRFGPGGDPAQPAAAGSPPVAAATAPGQTQAAPAQADDRSAFWQAVEQQRTRQLIWCDRQGGAREACGAATDGATYCQQFFGDGARYDDCQHAFHDPNIWYPVSDFRLGAASETRRVIDKLLADSRDRIQLNELKPLR